MAGYNPLSQPIASGLITAGSDLITGESFETAFENGFYTLGTSLMFDKLIPLKLETVQWINQ